MSMKPLVTLVLSAALGLTCLAAPSAAAPSPEAQAQFDLGEELKASHRLEEAKNAYLKAAELDRSFGKALNYAGLILQAQGQDEEAVALFVKAAKAQKGYSAPYKNMGQSLYKLGRLDEAAKALVEAIRILPDNSVEAHHVLGLVLSRQGKAAEAVEHLREAARLRPKNAEYRLFLGLALVSAGDTAGAEAQAQELSKLNAKLARVLKNRIEDGELSPAQGM